MRAKATETFNLTRISVGALLTRCRGCEVKGLHRRQQAQRHVGGGGPAVGARLYTAACAATEVAPAAGAASASPLKGARLPEAADCCLAFPVAFVVLQRWHKHFTCTKIPRKLLKAWQALTLSSPARTLGICMQVKELYVNILYHLSMVGFGLGTHVNVYYIMVTV